MAGLIPPPFSSLKHTSIHILLLRIMVDIWSATTTSSQRGVDTGKDLSLLNHSFGSSLSTRKSPDFPTTGTGLETVALKTFPVLSFTSLVVPQQLLPFSLKALKEMPRTLL